MVTPLVGERFQRRRQGRNVLHDLASCLGRGPHVVAALALVVVHDGVSAGMVQMSGAGTLTGGAALDCHGDGNLRSSAPGDLSAIVHLLRRQDRS